MLPKLVLITLIVGLAFAHPQYGPPPVDEQVGGADISQVVEPVVGQPLIDSSIVEQVVDPGFVSQVANPGIIPAVIDPGIIPSVVDAGIISPAVDPGIIPPAADPGFVHQVVNPEPIPPVVDTGISQQVVDPGISPSHTSDGAILTQEQKDELKDFWWKLEGTFGGAGKPEGEKPAGHPEGPSAGPFTPQQSPHCALNHDCVPWEKCVDGSIHAGPPKEGHSKPSSYDALKCGQEGNMCCSITPIQAPIIKNDPDIPLEYQCGHPSYDCVPYFQCDKGVINTDGEGLIDLRIRPTGSCVNPEYPDVPAVCCLIPGQPPTTPLPPPLDACPGLSLCVDISTCTADGFISTDGAGLIDIRAGHPPCYQADKSKGVCCSPPPVILDACPPTAACVEHGACGGKALDHANKFNPYDAAGRWSECTLNQYGKTGICCELPPPPPVPIIIDHCPSGSLCTEPLLCLGTALDVVNNFRDYASVGDWTFCKLGAEKGVCCIPPPPKLIACPSNSICVRQNSCTGTAMEGTGSFLKYDTARPTWAACDLGKHDDPGLCCINEPPAKPLIPASQCGIRNYHIDQRIQSNYAKNEAAFGEFPWQSIIFFQNYTFKCGASLISNRHVLTAAHCVQNLLASDIKIRLGEWQVNSFDELLPYEDHNVKTLHIHPNYNPKNVHNDIAVLELVEPIKLQYHINTICLPKLEQTFKNGEACYATGWGKDSFKGTFQHILKKIALPYVEQGLCETLLRKTRLGKYFKLNKSFVCAGGEENEDACFGDGGGPLICKNPETGLYELVGVTAWGIECGLKDVPGVYANVQLFTSWVDEIIHGFNQQQEQVGGGGAIGYGK